MGDDLRGRIFDALVDGLGRGPTKRSQSGPEIEASRNRRRADVLVPRIRISVGQDDFGVGVGCYQLGRKGSGWQVADRLAVTKQLVPLLLAKFSFTVPLRANGTQPHLAVAWGLGAGCSHVICLEVAQ